MDESNQFERIPDPPSWGVYVRAARQIGGWTISEFAHHLNTSRMAVWRWENGVNEPKLSTIQKAAELVGMSAIELMFYVRF